MRDGRAQSGLQVELSARRSNQVRVTDAIGRFEFDLVRPGEARITVEDTDFVDARGDRGRTLHRARFELEDGELKELQIFIETIEIEIGLVWAKTGAPVPGSS